MSTFSESHLDASDPLLRVVSCPTLRLTSTSRAESMPCLPRRSCSATPRGMNDSVCTQCLGIAFGDVEKTLLLGCFLTPECFDIEVIHGRFHTSQTCSVLLLVELVARNSASSSGRERCGQHVLVEDFWALLCFHHRLFPLPSSGPSRGRTVPAVVWFDDLATLLLDPARHPSARHGGRESSELKAFHRSCCHPTLLEHAISGMMSHMRFSSKYCVSRLKDADRPNTRV